MKVLRPDCAVDERVRLGFLQEGKLASRLLHPNIVRVVEQGLQEGWNYMVMELLEGEDLVVPIRRDGGLPPSTAVEVLLQVCDALEHAHQNGVVHNDLKPAHVMLVGDRAKVPLQVKIIDFGIATVLDNSEVRAVARATVGTQRLGTPAYTSPECASGEVTDYRHDIYSCGVILFELLSGQRPFDGATAVETLRMHKHDPMPRLSELMPIHPGLEAIVLQATAKLPGRRFSTAQQLATALRQVLPELGART